MMQLGLAIGACAVGLAWLISESVRRWFKQRADARYWEAIQEATISTVSAQHTTLPQAKTRKRKTRRG